ncbi:tRNA pseudouridine synthase B [bacterium BMS3Bbin12]|nr:tRNA pseudouridine synthase B [bacterium BMS3Abin12]GBE47741.1 tRNA pseudouridine synthase B [bacterium BMS3Bbin12]GBE51009.1 tRNA pseudouridine synthase B [bacterium BMS3Bbin13]HDK02258.1 tRNA pseudouridine(55) synthase TruB [Gammaproteobacteria bacterium]HDO33551.1 tRNA pseudouridine(55) synthase TruB [Chromatiales bacterium]
MMRERRRRRNISGIVLLDKDPGPTSNEALQVVKRLFQAQKAGHTGSLDPLASGLLPVCLGEATKVSGFLLDANKRYRVRCRLGQRTTTGDAEGEVVEIRPVEGLDRARVERVLEGFKGPQEQIPPMYSALKHQGQRLYKLARQGVEVERKPRPVVIHTLELLYFEGDTLEFDVRCSKGTYVRTLAEDIGAALGCGAHVIALRRLAVGPYDGIEMVDLETLRRLAAEGAGQLDTVLLPMESALAEWPDVRLSDDAAYYLRRGQPVLVPHAPTRGWVRLYARDRRFLGVGQILDDGRVAPRRLVSGA